MELSPTFHFTGILGDALEVVMRNWLMTAPSANPAMLEMFLDRDTQPYRDQVPWAGEFAGKYLTSAVQVLRCTGDRFLYEWLEDFVTQLCACQDTDGYLGPWADDSRLTNASYHHIHPDLPPGAPLQTWDTWGHYHVMMGLLLWDELVGDPQARLVVERIADLICQKYLGRKTPRLVDTGFSEMNLAPAHSLAILYRKTGKPDTLEMVNQIIEEFGAQVDGQYLAGDYLHQALMGKEFFQTPKPRWESLHPIMSLAELFTITGDRKYLQAFEQIWWSIQKNDRHNNGGFSSGEQATGNPYDPRPIETCCTIAWMALSVEMLKLSLDPRVADELELSTYNSILGMHQVSGRWATYNTPSDGIRFASAHQIVFQARPGSPELNCCSVNSPRGLGLLSDWAVLNRSSEVYINYYGPGEVDIPQVNGQSLRLVQITDYPLSKHVKITIHPSEIMERIIFLRIPGWSQQTKLSLNGVELPEVVPGKYLSIERYWKEGDEIDISLDFVPRFWIGERDCQGKVSIYRGPILLAYDLRYNRQRKNGRVEGRNTYGGDPWQQATELFTSPGIDMNNLKLQLKSWEGWLPPRLLFSVELTDGDEILLCDFASAGQTGTPYQSWLPLKIAQVE